MLILDSDIESAEPFRAESRQYKIRRKSGAETVIELMAFPVTSHSDPLYQAFSRKAALLKEAREGYDATIPFIYSWGISRSAHPFLERAFIDGPSLEERPGPVILEEIVQLAEQLARTLAHCHHLGLAHGRLDASHVRWDNQKARYLLMGFDLSADPTRPATGSVPVSVLMPQQNDASFREDVRSFGALLFYLLTQTQMGQGLPGRSVIESLREKAVASVPADQREKEKAIPDWMIAMMESCLSGNFSNGGELYHFILVNHKPAYQKKDWYRSAPQKFGNDQKPPLKRIMEPILKEKAGVVLAVKSKKWRSPVVAIALLISAAVVSILAALYYSGDKKESSLAAPHHSDSSLVNQGGSLAQENENTASAPEPREGKLKNAHATASPAGKRTPSGSDKKSLTVSAQDAHSALGAYKVPSKAYFYNAPDASTRRNAFIVHWNNAVLHPEKEQNGFVWIVYTNVKGQTSRGWMRKQDLVKIEE